MADRLRDATSPYLLQHAGNPVDWWPWCEEAFQAAARRDVPVMLSVGYSACHWCHVMAHESFEDEQVAGFVNTNFVSGAGQLVVSFDSSFQSCTASVTLGRESGKAFKFKGLNGKTFTATGTPTVSTPSCSIREGNPF